MCIANGHNLNIIIHRLETTLLLAAMSVTRGGPGFPVLADAVYNYFVSGKSNLRQRIFIFPLMVYHQF